VRELASIAPDGWTVSEFYTSGGAARRGAFRVTLPGERRLVVVVTSVDDGAAFEVRGVNYLSADGCDNVLFRLGRRDGARPSVTVSSLCDGGSEVSCRVEAALGLMARAGWVVGTMRTIE